MKIEKNQRIIFFDLGNVLFYRKISHKKQDIIFFRRYLPGISTKKIISAIEKAGKRFSLVYNPILPEGERLNLKEELLVYREFIKDVLNFLNLKRKEKLWQKFVNNRFGSPRYKLYQTSLALLNLFRRKSNIKYGVISDGLPSRRLILKNLGIEKYFAPNLIFISSELGFSKKSPKLFYLVWNLIGKPNPSQLILIDDSYQIIKLAKTIGWKCLLLDKKTRKRPKILLKKLNSLT